jgi:glycosyltransferase involved in cell wall biosynthesis
MTEQQGVAAPARVTVLMPVRAYQPAYLRQALESIRLQTSPRWRLLVVDDGSDGGFADGPGALFEDQRVRLLDNHGRGFAAALNVGLRDTRTEFVALLFADDLWAPNAVEVLTSFIERFPEVDFFHTSRAAVDEHGRPIGPIYHPQAKFTLEDFHRGSPVKHLLCWRRDPALAIGGMDESLDPIGIDDYDFPWRMAEAGVRFMAISDCLYLWRDHRESFRLTTHVPRNAQVRTLRRIMRKHGVRRARVELQIAAHRRSQLRQCLYRSPLDRWLKARLGHDPRRGWREPYC